MASNGIQKSDVAAIMAGGAATVVGLVAAFLTPVAGLVAGAYVTYTAAAGLGTAAAIALGAAGGVGGLVLGKIAAPFVAVASVFTGGLIGAAVKLGGSLFEKNVKQKPTRPAAPRGTETDLEMNDSRLSTLAIRAKFAAVVTDNAPTNDNKTPTAKPTHKKFFGMRF